MLLDSNLIIYAAQSEHENLRRFIVQNRPSVSSMTYVEVMDYQQLRSQDRDYFEQVFQTATILPISDAVIKKAFALRARKKMRLSDAIIAATALVHGLTLATRNTKDFSGIAGLSVLNPFDAE
jgi:hypothetical protein